MKNVLLISVGLFVSIMFWWQLDTFFNKNKRPVYVLHEVEKVAVPDFYRKILGYDSLEMIYSLNKWNVNFCYPNEWEYGKFKKIKVDSLVFQYDSIMVIHYNTNEVK